MQRVALITGSAKRVGRAIALELSQHDHAVVIHYRSSQTEAHALADQINAGGGTATTVSGDLSDPATCREIVENAHAAFNRLDVVINNAAVFESKSSDTVDAFDAGQWEHILRVNLVAPMAIVHAAVPYLGSSDNASVINLCDIAADRPWSSHLAYCASKAGLVTLTRALAKALAPAIRVVGISPGVAQFPESYGKKRRQELIASIPLARAGTPEEIARLVRFVAIEGTFITGEIITVDGGRSIS